MIHPADLIRIQLQSTKQPSGLPMVPVQTNSSTVSAPAASSISSSSTRSSSFSLLQHASSPIYFDSAKPSGPSASPSASTGHSGHGGGEAESPVAKFFISGSVAWTFELIIGHYLEFLKIRKQTSTKSYATITREMIQHKGLIGILDGYFPWGSIQCFIKGASFGFGQALGLNVCHSYLSVSPFVAEVLSGGMGGGVQGLMMSPLLLLKTRVMTLPEMRSVQGAWKTTVAATKMGWHVIAAEGPFALMKGSVVFSSKRVADWMTRYFFAEICSDALKAYHVKNSPQRVVVGKDGKSTVHLTFAEKSFTALLGGALSATSTLPIDVVVATIQSAENAGKKRGVLDIFREQAKEKGIMGVLQYGTRGYIARVAHVGATTLLMKSVSSAVYSVYNQFK